MLGAKFPWLRRTKGCPWNHAWSFYSYLHTTITVMDTEVGEKRFIAGVQKKKRSGNSIREKQRTCVCVSTLKIILMVNVKENVHTMKYAMDRAKLNLFCLSISI